MTQITKGGRLALIDIARGVALVAMTVYHFTWDLGFFGWILPTTVGEFGWVLFARCIAASFLFLVGVSLYLAHGRNIAEGIRWRSFWKRFAMVAASAMLISIVTYIATPDAFIFFGILHAIALFSVISLAFLRLPWWLIAFAAAAIFFGHTLLATDALASPLLWWLGLAPTPPASNDYVPLFPWLAATLVGLATAKIADQLGWFARIQGVATGSKSDKTLGFIGRHSLIYYLVHQPILIGLLWCFTLMAGPPDRTAEFLNGCAKTCSETSDPIFCEAFCKCTADGLKTEKLFVPLFAGEINMSTDPKAQKIINQCSNP